jgi:heterotetrameric sarcosine oxidase gamma subunit
VSSALHSKSALEGLAIPGSYGRSSGEAGVVISERIGLGLATVAACKGKADALGEAVASAYGVQLPSSSHVVQGPQVSFVGYGPGQWLAVSESLANEALARDLSEKLQGLASISDQSGGRAVLRLRGPKARDVLAKGLPIDLDPRAFPLGSAATSAISHMGVQLWQSDDTRSYDITIFRSVSESFWRWLTASAAEYGYKVVPERA